MSPFRMRDSNTPLSSLFLFLYFPLPQLPSLPPPSLTLFLQGSGSPFQGSFPSTSAPPPLPRLFPSFWQLQFDANRTLSSSSSSSPPSASLFFCRFFRWIPATTLPPGTATRTGLPTRTPTLPRRSRLSTDRVSTTRGRFRWLDSRPLPRLSTLTAR